MEPNNGKRKKYIKRAAAALMLLCIPVSIAGAWFTFSRKISTVVPVKRPEMLVLASGNKEDISQLYLGDIDVENKEGITYSDYVFSVYSEVNTDYYLEIAHTTNIEFQYQLFSAELSDTANNVNGGEYALYTTEDGNEQYYKKNSEITVEWLNAAGNYQAETDMNNDYYKKTYGGYQYVQSDAVPLYGITGKITHSSRSEFTDYYILRVNWEAVKDTIKNSKETDIIYLIAYSD